MRVAIFLYIRYKKTQIKTVALNFKFNIQPRPSDYSSFKVFMKAFNGVVC